MRINIKFIYLFGIFLIYFTDFMFFEVLFGKDSPLVMSYTKGVWAFTLIGSMYFYRYFSNGMKVWFILTFALFFYLILESYYSYGNPFVYPHVFSKVLIVFSTFFVYGFYRKFEDKLNFHQLIQIILFFFVINVVVVNRDAFSLSSFANHERGLLAASVYFLVIPFLYYFNRYFYDRKVMDLYLCFFVFALIIFLQHRTIWVSTAAALAFNILVVKKTEAKFTIETMIPIGIFIIIASFFAGFFIFSNETIMKKLTESIDDLMNPTSQGTGNFRYIQFTTYLPYVLDYPFFGMRFEGFELPVQFFDRDILVFEDGTGHHFHSTYLDKLFYLGIVGTLLFFIPPYLIMFLKLSEIKKLDISQVVLLSYVVTLFVFGLSYNINTHFYGTLGLAIFFLEKGDINQKKEVIPEE